MRDALSKQVMHLEARETTAMSEMHALRSQIAELTHHLQQVESQRAQAVGESGAAQGALNQREMK